MTSDNDDPQPRGDVQVRDHELISFTEFTQMAGVERTKAYQWLRTQKSFPEAVKEVPFGNGTVRYFVVADIVNWLLHHRPSPEERARERDRLRVYLAQLAEERAALEAQLRHKVSISEQIESVLEG